MAEDSSLKEAENPVKESQLNEKESKYSTDQHRRERGPGCI